MALFVTGLGAPETPRPAPDGSWMCVEMAPPRSGVTRISADGGTIALVAQTGCPNGLCVDRTGIAWVAETSTPALLRVTTDGSVETIVGESDIGPFLLPNDLCFSLAGRLYMTDSGLLMSDWAPDGSLRTDWQTAAMDGRVYEIDIHAKKARAIDSGLRFANGIAFGPDGHLYANEMITGNIYRYDAEQGVVVGPRTLFANVLSDGWGGGFRGPDGMAFSADGRLWCSVYGEANVAVVSPAGKVIDRLRTDGNAPTNVAFGANGERRIYVSEHQKGQIEVYDVEARGLTLHAG